MNEITNIYTVYDKIAEKYGPIFEAINEGVATRQFRNLLETLPKSSQDDYQLMLIGFLERGDSCRITPNATIQLVDTINGDDIRRIK